VATIDKEKVEARLNERAAEIEERLRQIRAADEGMRDSELADYDQHPADEGTETLEQEIDETTRIMLEQDMRNVEEAGKRLAEGTYGTCIDCGNDIPQERLDAVPEAIRCIEDQNRYEAALRARGGPPAAA
jgi:DnaK suppressor protein